MDKYTLKASLTETFKGIIWKIETDYTYPVVAIETRNIADRVTYYSAFNYETGKLLFKEITIEDSWFWGIDRVHKGIVFLHSYVHESHPEHKGIIALNNSGEIEWRQFNKTLYDISEHGLIIYNPKIQPKTFELISPETGAALPQSLKQFLPLSRNILIPDILSNISDFRHLLPENVIAPVFYKKFNNKDIFAYHIKNGDLFSQQLAVYEEEKLILKDILADNIQKLNPEAFFIEQDHLFCIRNNKQEFVSYLV